ncbi:MAG: helix-turn-helix domain-containing protein [Acidimicrobiia bacterium]
MTRPAPREHLIDTTTAGIALGVSDRTIRRYVTDGMLTNHGHGRRILIDVAELTETTACQDDPAEHRGDTTP